MKKMMTMAAVAVAIAFSACAQKLRTSDVPAEVKAAFANQFPGTTPKWEKEDGSYEAGFKKDGRSNAALFTANGTLMETEVEMEASALPARVLSYMNEHYKGKKIKEAAKITLADGTINYEAEVGGKDVIFDASGNFIKVVEG